MNIFSKAWQKVLATGIMATGLMLVAVSRVGAAAEFDPGQLPSSGRGVTLDILYGWILSISIYHPHHHPVLPY